MNVRLIAKYGTKRRQTFHLRDVETIIGRRSGSGIRIPSKQVSRQHCRLYLERGVLMLEDLNSINGTRLNDVEVLQPEIVRPGDKLQVGPVTFQVDYQLSPEAMQYLREQEMHNVGFVELIEDDEEEYQATYDDAQLADFDAEPEYLEAIPIEDDDGDFDEDLPSFVPLEENDSETVDEDWDLPLDLEEVEPENEEFGDFLSQLEDDELE